MLIRDFKDRDLFQILELINENEPEINEEQLLEEIKDSNIIVADEEGQILAMGELKEKREIKRLYTLPEERGSGVRVGIMYELEEMAALNNSEVVRLYASEIEKMFFEKQGYKSIKQVRRQYKEGLFYTRYVMEKYV